MNKSCFVFFNTFDNCTIKDTDYQNEYNLMRSHSYFLFQLAYNLKVDAIFDYGVSHHLSIHSQSDITYSLKGTPYDFDDIPSWDLDKFKSDWNRIGVIQMMNCDYIQEDRLIDFLNNIDSLIYQSSDWELVSYGGDYNNFFLRCFIDKSVYSKSTWDLVDSKLKIILTPHLVWMNTYKQLTNKEVLYTPFYINPNIPVIENDNKLYDSFFISRGEDITWLDGFSVLATSNSGCMSPGSDKIIQKSNNVRIGELVKLQSLSRYTIFTNRDTVFGGVHKFICNSNIVDTHKLLECYYSGSYPVNPNSSKSEVRFILGNKDPKVDEFRSYVKLKHTLDFKNYNLSKIKGLLKYE